MVKHRVYGLYRSGGIKKIVGDPRSLSNQQGLIVWDKSKEGVKSWSRKWLKGSRFMKSVVREKIKRRRK